LTGTLKELAMPAQASLVRYLTHPEVAIDPAKPVPEWSLSPVGRARAALAARSAWLWETATIVSSAERKAIETAEIVGAYLGLGFEIRPEMHENDRSATGFLPQAEFAATADQFFAQPEISVRGWERAIDAQARIVREVETVLAKAPPGDILLVGHGGVGTLLFCHYSKAAISRKFDQPGGGGSCFAFRRGTREIVHPWRGIEEMAN
jgi:broad specificity phosphatase PhoE